jgi:hypothetical protein
MSTETKNYQNYFNQITQTSKSNLAKNLGVVFNKIEKNEMKSFLCYFLEQLVKTYSYEKQNLYLILISSVFFSLII